MISDVPGYTWGTVTAMAQAGIKYFSVGANSWIGSATVMVEWENKPFWWIGPDGNEPGAGLDSLPGLRDVARLRARCRRSWWKTFARRSSTREYPYDIAYVRWAGHGDNAMPDPAICDFVKEWNAAHAWPQFVISSTSEAFRALETALRRQAAAGARRLDALLGGWCRLVGRRDGHEPRQFRTAGSGRNPLGACWPPRAIRPRGSRKPGTTCCSTRNTPGARIAASRNRPVPFTADQWKIKQSFATAANLQSRQLLSRGRAERCGLPAGRSAAAKPDAGEKFSRVDVYNTSSWPRTEVVYAATRVSERPHRVTDDQGRPVPSQRLASGELAVLVRDLPPLSGRRYTIAKEGARRARQRRRPAGARSSTTASSACGSTSRPAASSNCVPASIDANLVDAASGHAINDYLYLIGDDLAGLQQQRAGENHRPR